MKNELVVGFLGDLTAARRSVLRSLGMLALLGVPGLLGVIAPLGVIGSLGGTALAGAPASATRAANLPWLCQGGARNGRACVADADCGGGKCRLDIVSGTRRVDGRVTIIVDDDVSKFDGTEEVPDVVAVTVLLEAWNDGVGLDPVLVSQTYQNLEGVTLAELIEALQAGPFVADTHLSGGGGGTGTGGGDGGGGGGGTGDQRRGNRVTEALMHQAASRDDLLDDFLFQEGDSAIADAVRCAFDVAGRPVITETERHLGRVEYADHTGDGLASVLRLRVEFAFVSE